MSWYRESQHEINRSKASSLEKWIISAAKQMYKLFLSSGGEFSEKNDYQEYMDRIESLANVMKIYIDELRDYPTVSRGKDRSIVETAKNVVGNLTGVTHSATNLLQKLFMAIEFAGYGEEVELV